MAFKNILLPNVAVGGDLYGNTNGVLPNHGTLVYDTSKKYSGNGSVRATPTQTWAMVVYLHYNRPVKPSTTYTVSVMAETNCANYNIRPYYKLMSQPGDVSPGVTGNLFDARAWNKVSMTFTTLPNTATAYVGIQVYATTGEYIWVDTGQLEENTQATEWEFPGIDLTNQAITGQEHVNNLTLENILTLSPIQSQEYVNNVILENVINLLGLQSLENVEDLKILNEIVLTGIESVETFGELIIYIYYNLIRTDLVVKHPEILCNIKKPRTVLNIKHPSIRRLN